MTRSGRKKWFFQSGDQWLAQAVKSGSFNPAIQGEFYVAASLKESSANIHLYF